MGQMDTILEGVKPLPSGEGHSTRTQKAEAWYRHQSPATGGGDNPHFGLGTVSSEIIESQMIKGKGRWHPSNVNEVPLEQLREDALALSKGLGPEPGYVTPQTVLGKEKPTPFSFYRDAGGTAPDANVMNTIELGGTFVSLDTLADNIVRKVSEGRTYSSERAHGYINYFQWLIDCLEDSLVKGEDYLDKISEWRQNRILTQRAIKLYEDQQSYENSLSGMHRRTLEQDKRIAELEAQLLEVPAPKPKRKRRTKAEMEAARKAESMKNEVEQNVRQD